MPGWHKKIPKFLNDIELKKLLSAPDRSKTERERKYCKG
jgi:hypothetical protein